MLTRRGFRRVHMLERCIMKYGSKQLNKPTHYSKKELQVGDFMSKQTTCSCMKAFVFAKIPLLSRTNVDNYIVKGIISRRVYTFISRVVIANTLKIFTSVIGTFFNPLRPNSDLSQTSHCNIKGLSISEVMRIENMITQVKLY